MLSTIARFRDRTSAALAVFRSYDAAASGRRWRGTGEMPNQRHSIAVARGPVGRRARYLVANSPLAANAVEAWTTNAVGTGVKPQSAHPDPQVRAAINAAYERWVDNADADGVLDFYGQQSLAFRRMVTDGDVFGALSLDGERGNPLRVRLIDAEQVDPALTRELPGGGRIVAGVEFDSAGRRIAYHALSDRREIAASFQTIRLPAEMVVHLFKPEVPGQARGVSWFAPVLLRAADADALNDAQLMRQKIASLLTGFVIEPNGQPTSFGGAPSADGSAIDASLEPGTMKLLTPGQDVRFSDPAEIGSEAIEFIKITAREIAAGLGIPYEVMTGDLTSVNFSSIRAGLIEFRRRVEAIQHNVFVFRFCLPIWQRFVTIAALRGDIDARGFTRDPDAFMAVKWITPRREWVDPLKDARAEIEAINAGLMSRREAVASRGWDIEQLDEEIAADHARATSLGLAFAAPHSPIEPTEAQP